MPRFVRPYRGRVIAGVAAAVAEQLRVDVLLVRLVWIALVFAAGTGVLAYIVLAVLTPEQDQTGAVIRSRALVPTLVVAGVLLIALILTVVLSLAV